MINEIIPNAIKSVADGVKQFVTTDKDKLDAQNESEKIANDALDIANKPAIAQAQANIDAVKHTSVFVAGGRPAILWVTALLLLVGLGSYYVVYAIIWACMCFKQWQLLPYDANLNILWELVASVLGLYGTQRTIEKIKLRK